MCAMICQRPRTPGGFNRFQWTVNILKTLFAYMLMLPRVLALDDRRDSRDEGCSCVTRHHHRHRGRRRQCVLVGVGEGPPCMQIVQHNLRRVSSKRTLFFKMFQEPHSCALAMSEPSTRPTPPPPLPPSKTADGLPKNPPPSAASRSHPPVVPSPNPSALCTRTVRQPA